MVPLVLARAWIEPPSASSARPIWSDRGRDRRRRVPWWMVDGSSRACGDPPARMGKIFTSRTLWPVPGRDLV